MSILIGPLAHVAHRDKAGDIVCYTIDYSKPGAIERFEAEFDLREADRVDIAWRGKFPGP